MEKKNDQVCRSPVPPWERDRQQVEFTFRVVRAAGMITVSCPVCGKHWGHPAYAGLYEAWVTRLLAHRAACARAGGQKGKGQT